MTPINRRLRRQTASVIHSAGRRRYVVLELSPGGDGTPGPGFVGFRLMGTRTIYYLPVDWCFREALKAELARRRAERKAKRKAGVS